MCFFAMFVISFFIVCVHTFFEWLKIKLLVYKALKDNGLWNCPDDRKYWKKLYEDGIKMDIFMKKVRFYGWESTQQN